MNRSLVHAFLEVTRNEGKATSYAFTPEDMFGRPELLVGQPKVPSADVLGLLRHARDRNLVLGRIERSGAGRPLVRVGESARVEELKTYVRGLAALVPWLEMAVFVGLRDPDPDFETEEEEQRRLLLRELAGPAVTWDSDRARRVYQFSQRLGEVAGATAPLEDPETTASKLVAIEGGLRGYRAKRGKVPLGDLVGERVPTDAVTALDGAVATGAAPVVKAATSALMRCASLVALLQGQVEDGGVPRDQREGLERDYHAAQTLAAELVELLEGMGGAASAEG